MKLAIRHVAQSRYLHVQQHTKVQLLRRRCFAFYAVEHIECALDFLCAPEKEPRVQYSTASSAGFSSLTA